jgi:predicted phage terminase large subunit-like protein
MVRVSAAGRQAQRREADRAAEAATRAALVEASDLIGQLERRQFSAAHLARMGVLLPLLPPAFKIEMGRLLAHVAPAPDPIPFREFVARAKPDYRWYDYGERIEARLMDVIEGRLSRLMIFAPPRHGKSELVSRLFSAYYQYRFPHRWVGLCSYGSDLAGMLARSARDNFVRAGGKLGALRDETAVRTIGTAASGGMWAAGVGGPITGKGFHLGIIDDPLKNSEESQSVTIREKQKEWWQGTFSTRAEPNASIVIVMTPWHEDDLANWLLRRETSGEGTYPERWHIIALDALRDTSEKFFVPPTCTLEPDPRAEGEALCEERYPRTVLLRKRQSMGAYYWSAMYQARPKPKAGILLKREWFRALHAMPKVGILAAVRYWDLAATAKEDATEHDPDFTRSTLMLAVTMDAGSDTAENGSKLTLFVIADATGGQMSPKKRDDHIVKVTADDAARFGQNFVTTWLERDSGGGGRDRTKALVGKLAGHRVRTEAPLGMSKELRGEPLRDQAEARNVAYVVGDWNAELFEEICGFPYAAHDDYWDSTVGAFVKCSDAIGGRVDVEVRSIGYTESEALAVPGVIPADRFQQLGRSTHFGGVAVFGEMDAESDE